MAQKERPADPAMDKLTSTPFFELGQQRAEAMVEFQKELLATFEQSNKEWLERMKQEAELVSELTAKLSGAKSIPDAAGIYQEWMGRRVELMRQDAQKLVEDSQKLVSASARIFSGVGPLGGSS
jgi:ABC-type uncharacterized transport system involved in gliding motility auxiliary subunit